MSIMHMGAMPAAAAQLLEIGLQGGLAQDATGFLQARAGWQILGTGFIRRYEGGSFTNFVTDVNWAVPQDSPSFNKADYDVRLTTTSGGSNDNSTPNGVWLTMNTTGYFWEWTCNRFCVEFATNVMDIRHTSDGSQNTATSLSDGAPCIASANFNIAIEAT